MQNDSDMGRRESISNYGKGAIRKTSSKRSHKSSKKETRRISNTERSSSKPKNTNMNSISKITNTSLNIEMPIFEQEDSSTVLLKADSLLRATKQQLVDLQFAFQETKYDPVKNLKSSASEPTSGNDPPLTRELITATFKGDVSDYKAFLLSGPLTSANEKQQNAIDNKGNRNMNPAEGLKMNEENSGTAKYLDYSRALHREIFNTKANVEGALNTAKDFSSLLTDGVIKDLCVCNPEKASKNYKNDTYTKQEAYLKNSTKEKDKSPYKFNIPDYDHSAQLTVKEQTTDSIPTNDENNEDKIFCNYDQINPMPMISENFYYCSNCTSIPISDMKPEAHNIPDYCDCRNCMRNTVSRARIWQKKLQLTDQRTSIVCKNSVTNTNCTCSKDISNFKGQTKSNCTCIKTCNCEKSTTELQEKRIKEKCSCKRVCTCGESIRFSKCSNSAVIHMKTCLGPEDRMTKKEIHAGRKLLAQALPSVSIKRELSVQKIPTVRIPPPGAPPYVSATKNVALWGVSHSQIELDLWDCPSSPCMNKQRRSDVEMVCCKEEPASSKCSYTQTFARNKRKGGKCNLVFQTMPAIDLDSGLCAECNEYLSKQELKIGYCTSCRNKSQGTLSESKIYQEKTCETQQSNLENKECRRCLKLFNISDLYCGMCKTCNISIHEEITKLCLTTPTPDMIKAVAHLVQCDECHRHFPKSELFQGHCIMCQITKKEVRLYQCDFCLNSVPSTEYFEGKCVQCQILCSGSKDKSGSASCLTGITVVHQNLNSVFDGTPFLFDLNVAQGINRISSSDKNMNEKAEKSKTYSRVPTGRDKDKVGKSDMKAKKENLMQEQHKIIIKSPFPSDASEDRNENNFMTTSQESENGSYRTWYIKKESESKFPSQFNEQIDEQLNEAVIHKNDLDSNVNVDSDTTSQPGSIQGWINDKHRTSSVSNDPISGSEYRKNLDKRHSKVRYLIDTGVSRSDSYTSATKINSATGMSVQSVQFVDSEPEIIGVQDASDTVRPGVLFDNGNEVDNDSSDSDYEKYMFEKRNAFKRRATPYFGKKEAQRLSQLFSSIIRKADEEPEDTSLKPEGTSTENEDNLNKWETERLSIAIVDVLDSENESHINTENGDEYSHYNSQNKKKTNPKAKVNTETENNKVRHGSVLNNGTGNHNENNRKTSSLSQNINEIKLPKVALMVKVKPNRKIFKEESPQEMLLPSQNGQQNNVDKNKILMREQETQTTSRQTAASQTTSLFMPESLERFTDNIDRSFSGVILRKTISKYNPAAVTRPTTPKHYKTKELDNSMLADIPTGKEDEEVGKVTKNINRDEDVLNNQNMEETEDSSITSETDAKKNPEEKNTNHLEEVIATDDKTSVTEGDDIYEDDWEEEPERKDSEDRNDEKYDTESESDIHKTVKRSKEEFDGKVSSPPPKLKSPRENLEKQQSPEAIDPSKDHRKNMNCQDICEICKKAKAGKVEGENSQMLPATNKANKLSRKKRQPSKNDTSDISTRKRLSGESNKIKTHTVQSQKTKYPAEIRPGKAASASQEKSDKRIAEKPRTASTKNKENINDSSDFHHIVEEISASIPVRSSVDIPNAEKEISMTQSPEIKDTIKCPIDIPCKLINNQVLLAAQRQSVKCPLDVACTKKVLPCSGTKVVKCPIDIPCSEKASEPPDDQIIKGIEYSIIDKDIPSTAQTTKCFTDEPCKRKDRSSFSKKQSSKVAKCPIEIPCSEDISIPTEDENKPRTSLDASTSPTNILCVDRATSSSLLMGKTLMDRETSPIDIPKLEASTSPMSVPEMVDKQISSASILDLIDRQTSPMSLPEMVDKQTSATFECVDPMNNQSSEECVCEAAVARNICFPDVNEQTIITCVASDSSVVEKVLPVETPLQTKTTKEKDFPCKPECSKECAGKNKFVSRCMSVVERMRIKSLSQQNVEQQEPRDVTYTNSYKRKEQRKSQLSTTETADSIFTSSEDESYDMDDSNMKIEPSEGEFLICSVCSLGEFAATNNTPEDLSDPNMKSSSTGPISVGEVWSCQCLDGCCLCSEGEVAAEHKKQFQIKSRNSKRSTSQDRAPIEIYTSSLEEDWSSIEEKRKSKDVKGRQQKYDYYVCQDCGARCWSRPNSSSEGENEDNRDLSTGQIRRSKKR